MGELEDSTHSPRSLEDTQTAPRCVCNWKLVPQVAAMMISNRPSSQTELLGCCLLLCPGHLSPLVTVLWDLPA